MNEGQATPDVEAILIEHESATGAHYLHSSLETLARLEKARAALRRLFVHLEVPRTRPTLSPMCAWPFP